MLAVRGKRQTKPRHFLVLIELLRKRNLTAHGAHPQRASGSGCSAAAFLGKDVGCLKPHPVLGVGLDDLFEIEGELRGEMGLAVEDSSQFGVGFPPVSIGPGALRSPTHRIAAEDPDRGKRRCGGERSGYREQQPGMTNAGRRSGNLLA